MNRSVLNTKCNHRFYPFFSISFHFIFWFEERLTDNLHIAWFGWKLLALTVPDQPRSRDESGQQRTLNRASMPQDNQGSCRNAFLVVNRRDAVSWADMKASVRPLGLAPELRFNKGM